MFTRNRLFREMTYIPTKDNMDKVQFGITPGEISARYGGENLSFISFVTQGYDKVVSNKKFRREKRVDLIAALKEAGFKSFEYLPDTMNTFINDKMIVLIGHKELTLMAKTHEYLVEIGQFVKPFLYDEERVLTFFYMSVHGITREEISASETTKIIYPELYPTIDIGKLREQFDASEEKILILYGEPGVGKTTFLQYLIGDNFYKKVGYVKDKATLANSQLWCDFTDEDWDLIVFDDLDDILQSRNENTKHGDFVSQLLSYSDGLVRRPTKIVITTNQSISEIDPAITRPGRCFDFLVLPPLSGEQALEIWTTVLKQTAESYHTRFGEAVSVTQAALMSEYFQVINNQTERSYIKIGERSYSIRQKLEDMGIASGARSAGFRGK